MAERLDEAELKALIAEEIRAAVNFSDSELVSKRVTALEYHRGEMNDTPSMPGRSKVVSRDVADTISWIVPGIIRVFDASDRMAQYEPENQNDEEGAKQATDYINYVFKKDNPGYRILWEATQDALLLGNGIVKHYWDQTEKCEYSEHTGMTALQIELLKQDDGVQITAQKQAEPQKVPAEAEHIKALAEENGIPPEQIEAAMQQGALPQIGQEIELPTWDIKVKRTDKMGKLCVECIEPENFLMDGNARTIEEARFTAHRDPNMTRSNLIKMGFDKDIVDNLPAYFKLNETELDTARDTKEQFRVNDVGAESETLIELFECYVKCDVDGDGESETVRAYYAGSGGAGELLDWEVWDDDVPFSDIPCEPVAHRWDARSIADKTIDIQRIKTVLLRQLLDNTYAVGLPMQEVEEGSVLNPEMLTSPKFGGMVLKKKGSLPVVPHVIPYVGDKLLMGLEFVDQITEKRTGVSRATMALDPETLQNQTAEANRNQKDASYSQVELIARNMAELGWKRVFRQLLRLIVKHQDRPRTIRLRDKWVEMDPRHWNANMDVEINVGLGTGSRDRDLAMLNNVLGTQMGLLERFAGMGLMEQGLDMLQRVMKTAQKQAESSGLHNPDEYYPTYDDQAIQSMAATIAEKASQPPIELQLEQAKGQTAIQIEQGRTQAQAQLKQQEMQINAEGEVRKSQADVTKEAAQLEADMQTKDKDRENELILEAARQQFEREKLAEESRQKELDRQQALLIETMKMQAQQAAQKEQFAHEGEQKKTEGKQKTNEAMIKAGKNPVADGVDPAELIKLLTAPKRIVRGKDGRATHVETMT